MSATKRPWSIKHSDDSSYFSIVDCNGGEVADDGSACDEYSKSMQLDTAELIVRAVNCFDAHTELADACQALFDAPHPESFVTRLNDEESTAICRIRTALAQAKEEKQ